MFICAIILYKKANNNKQKSKKRSCICTVYILQQHTEVDWQQAAALKIMMI
jgi:hypothetical protein